MAYQNFSGKNNNQGGYNRNNNNRQREIAKPIMALKLSEKYLDEAEECMRENSALITTSKIRRLYSLITEIYDREKLRTENNLLSEDISAVAMARIRIAYECGRDPKVKSFAEVTKIMEYLKGIGNSRDEFIKFAKYMEALVAYHKFFGGREN